MKIPGYVVSTGSTGVVSVWNEDMSTKLVNNRTVASYVSMTVHLLVPPQENHVTWGGNSRSKNIGIRTLPESSYPNVATETDLAITGTNGTDAQCFLPNGQLFAYQKHDSLRPDGPYFELYDYLSDTLVKITPSPSGTAMSNPRVLPTGKVLSWGTGKPFVVFDFGISPSSCPVDLCTGPFGFNGCRYN
jgi:hypothetical protein